MAQTATIEPDFYAITHGSVWRIRAVSEAAKELAEESFPVEGWMGEPTNFCTDWRAAAQLCDQLESEGYTVGRM